MNFGSIHHGKLKVIVKPNKLRASFKKNRAEIEIETSVDDIHRRKTIVLFWTAWIYLGDELTHTIYCGFQTKCPVEDDTERNGDFEKVLAIVASSCDEFFDKISRFTGTTPLIEPKFQILALRILEALILTH